MTILENLVETPLAGALGWAVMHSLWEGLLVAAALAAVLAVARSPRTRYAAASIALLALVAGFVATLAITLPDPRGAFTVIRTAHHNPWAVRVALQARNPWEPGIAAVAPWLAPFWLAGVLAFSLRHAAGLAAVRRLRSRGVCSVPDYWQGELARLRAQLRISRPVVLLESCLADTPLVLGHFRPYILLPVGLLTGFSPAQVEAILLHELAHIRRHDYLVNALQRVVEALLFYHPAAWWISHVMRVEREHCCDDAVISIRGGAREYALALARLEENRWLGQQEAVAATGGSLVKRIRRLLDPQRPNGAWTPVLAAAAILALGATTLAAWPHPAPAAQAIDQKSAASKNKAWLNEVAYIIDDAERGAFQRLATDAERDKFIEQFWERRNPTPGAASNPFKEEHYRRLAYAERYKTRSGTPGWQTDRGHMYIMYGPPDEIESHPTKTAQYPHPTEAWLYRHVDGIGANAVFTFIDANESGDYRLAPVTDRMLPKN